MITHFADIRVVQNAIIGGHFSAKTHLCSVPLDTTMCHWHIVYASCFILWWTSEDFFGFFNQLPKSHRSRLIWRQILPKQKLPHASVSQSAWCLVLSRPWSRQSFSNRSQSIHRIHSHVAWVSAGEGKFQAHYGNTMKPGEACALGEFDVCLTESTVARRTMRVASGAGVQWKDRDRTCPYLPLETTCIPDTISDLAFPSLWCNLILVLVGFICLQSFGLVVASVRGIALIAAAAAAGEWVECSRPGLTVVGGRHSCLAPGSDSGAGQALWGGGKVEDRGGGKVEGGGRDQKVKWGARRGPTVLR